jgi:hypothetical protein
MKPNNSYIKFPKNTDEMVQNRNFFHNKILEILEKDGDAPKELKLKLDNGEIIRFADLTKKEKAFIIANKSLQTAISTFALWYLLIEISVPIFNYITIPFVDQFTWGLVIQATASAIFGQMDVIDKITSRYFPSYIQDNRLKQKLRKVGGVENLAKMIENDGIINADDELIKKLGDSSYHFTMLGMGGKKIKSKLGRIAKNALNQLENRAIFSFREYLEKNNFREDGKLTTLLKALFLKIFYTATTFLINAFAPNAAEDFTAGLIGNLTKFGPPLTALATSTVATSLTFISETNKMFTGLNKAHIIGVRPRDKINLNNTKQSLKEFGLETLKTLKILPKEILVSGISRAIGRVAFEGLVKPIMYDDVAVKSSKKVMNALYEGLRSGLGQQGPKYLANSLVGKLENYFHNKSRKTELINHNIISANIKLSEYVLKQTINLNHVIKFLNNMQTSSKDLKKLKQNWLLSIYSVKEDLVNIHNIIKADYSSPQALVGCYYETYNVIKDSSKIFTVIGEYCSQNNYNAILPILRDLLDELKEQDLIKALEKRGKVLEKRGKASNPSFNYIR